MGRISGPSVSLLEKAGIGLTDNSSRKLFSNTFDPEISVMFTRAADIPVYVADGAADIGITGFDLTQEKNVDVEFLDDLKYKCHYNAIKWSYRGCTTNWCCRCYC